MRPITEIIVHCSATKWTVHVDANLIRQWHTHSPFNFSDIGYHFVILRDGTIEEGRRVGRIGAHVRGHNEESIGICLIGGLDRDNKVDANFSLKQYNSLATLVATLKEDNPKITKLSGHRDYSRMKACPCFDIEALLSEE